MNRLARLGNNLRFYILAGSVLLSILITSYLRLKLVDDRLFYIRLEQVFGFIAVAYVYVAVLMTPLSKLLPKSNVMSWALFARRAIGVSAAYFAILHVSIVLAKQTDGLSGLTLLPGRFKFAFFIGFIALIILFLMMITSLDKAIDIMTFKHWKQLHRFVYLAGVLIVIHTWLIGTHANNVAVQFISVEALAVLFALEARRMTLIIAKKRPMSKTAKWIVTGLLFAVMLFALFALPALTKNYHASSSRAAGGH